VARTAKAPRPATAAGAAGAAVAEAEEQGDGEAEALAEALRSLATATRIQLLRELRVPRALSEIALRPGGPGSPRVLARQTVKEHLDRLVEAGIVVTREADRAHGRVLEYIVNHRAIFSLGEDLRGLARLRPAEALSGLTQLAPPPSASGRSRGPALVLVKGLDEGHVFDLRPPQEGEAEWIIGRKRGLAVPLDFDASVSSENSRVRWDGSAYWVEDLPHSRNGTRLNFQDLERGVPRRLEPGDVIGVGRSSLVFRR
jgi:DNA-binding transcriptional ArsR family regulator